MQYLKRTIVSFFRSNKSKRKDCVRPRGLERYATAHEVCSSNLDSAKSIFEHFEILKQTKMTLRRTELRRITQPHDFLISIFYGNCSDFEEHPDYDSREGGPHVELELRKKYC